MQFGAIAEDRPGLDLTGLIVGSEGTLAVVTRVWVRLTRDPQGWRTMLGIFESVTDATNAISAIIGAGIIPAALEMMDQGILVAVEQAFHFGFPLDAQAILLIEVDGLRIDPARRSVELEGRPVHLTYVEFELLRTLAARPGRVFSRQALLESIRGGSEYREPRTIDVHVRHLREKLELDARDPKLLLTVRGVGYRFREP